MVFVTQCVIFLLWADLKQELAVQHKQERKSSISLFKEMEKTDAAPVRPSSVVNSALPSILATPSRPPGSMSAFNTPPASYNRRENPFCIV